MELEFSQRKFQNLNYHFRKQYSPNSNIIITTYYCIYLYIQQSPTRLWWYMSHLIDILSCTMKGVFQLKPPFSVIAQEINRVNGGLVLQPKLLCVEIKNNTHMRISTTHLEIQVVSTIMALCSSRFSEHLQEKTVLLLLEVAPLLCSQRWRFFLCPCYTDIYKLWTSLRVKNSSLISS